MARIDRFELRGLLGQGGFGEVLRAHDPRSGREVALKRLGAEAWLDPELRARFLREAEALTRVRDPGLVEVLETGVHQGRPWLAMGLVPGESLAARLQRTGPLPVDEALAVARALASTLSRLHARGVVHRDLKPQNVMLTPAGDPVLLDLGLALLLDVSQRLTSSGEVLGTPGYISPEQAGGRLGDMGPATDVYGLGGLLYAMLTGRPPFAGEGVLRVLQAVLTSPPAPPSRARAGLPAWLDQLVLRCLAKQPRERPSLEEVAATLASRAAPAEATSRRPVAAARRHGTRWALAGASLVLLAGLLLLLSQGPSPAPTQEASDAPVLSARGHLERGHGRYRARDTVGALAEVEAALALDPRLAEAHVTRGYLLARLGRVAEALAACERGLELDPRQAAAWFDRAQLHEQLEDWKAALADYGRALELEPDRLEALVNRGMLRLEQGDPAGAVVDLEAARRVAPNEPQVLRGLGKALLRQGEQERGLALLGQAIELHPLLAELWNERGAAYLRLGDLQRALVDLDRALELDPRLVSALVNRGLLQERLGDPARAQADWERARELDPQRVRRVPR